MIRKNMEMEDTLKGVQTNEVILKGPLSSMEDEPKGLLLLRDDFKCLVD